MTGFRVAYGGAQALYGVRPDLSLFGKVIGGGLPVGAYGGRRDLMEQIAPSGPVYQAGTLSGSPPAMAAGIAALDVLRENPDALRAPGSASATASRPGSKTAAADAGVACAVGRVGQHGHAVPRDRRGPLLRRREAGRPRAVRAPPRGAGSTRASSGRPRNSRPRFFRRHTRMRTWTGRSKRSPEPCPRSQSDLRGSKKMVLDWRPTC